MSEQDERTIYVFSRPHLEKYFVNYIDKVVLLGIFIILSAALIEGHFLEYRVRWTIFLIAIFLLAVCFEIIFRRFAYEITIDLDTFLIKFYMLRGKGQVRIGIEDINEIRLNLYVSFILAGKVIMYNDVRNKDLIDILSSTGKVKWGLFARLLWKIGW